MKESAQLLLKNIKSLLAGQSFQFLLMAIAFLLVIAMANACYDFGKEIGASVYFLSH